MPLNRPPQRHPRPEQDGRPAGALPQPEAAAEPVARPAAPLSHEDRLRLFGEFRFEAKPLPNNPENIEVLDGWNKRNIVPVRLPLNGRTAWVHRLIETQFRGLWQDWVDAGLLDRVLTFNGAYVARYKRGRSGDDENLSNHAWGTAFDINAAWNPLGKPPAPIGTKGSVLELVPFAEKRGFVWGGSFKGGRVDAMHFEAFKVIP
jgi:hypothetical protein